MFSDPDAISLIAGGSDQAYCGRSSALRFAGTALPQMIETADVALSSDSVLFFELTAGCGTPAPAIFVVDVMYADDYGLVTATNFGPSVTWQYITPSFCDPTISVGCQNWTGLPPPVYISGTSLFNTAFSGSIFSSLDVTTDPLASGSSNWTRVALPLPPSTRAGRRYRISVQTTSGSRSDWAIANFWLGAGCGGDCGGRGICVAGACVCDAGFALNGSSCVVDGIMLTELRESFDSGPLSPQRWMSLRGGVVGGTVGGSPVLASGPVLSFSALNSGSRRVITVDMDTRSAQVVQFYFYQVLTGVRSVVVSFSADGGRTWQRLATMTASDHFAVPLPAAAQAVGVRFMWWQPNFRLDGSSSLDLWVSGHVPEWQSK
jgi:hypothetical protein